MKKMLVADNTEMNQSILYEIFSNEYEYIQTDSSEAFFRLLIQYKDEISVVIINESIAVNISEKSVRTLSDLKIFDNIPVIIILNGEEYNVRGRNINLRCSDFINSPVNPYIAKRRVANIVELFSHKTKLEKLVKQQTRKILEQNRALKIQQKKINTINNDMLDTLSTIIEYRDVESGRHIHRIRKFTEVLLNVLEQYYPKYNLTAEKISLITSASSLHDIGKITIPDAILLSPRRLTYDEFRVMKMHTVRGCEILEQLESVEKNDYYMYCYDICRYHHEKYDGLGYPDGLVGDEIPIWAQVVSLADCYDALTSERPYKAAFSHEQAVEMIRSGACGAFSDEMMDCFSKVLPQFKALAKEYADVNNADRSVSDKNFKKIVQENAVDHTMDIYLKMDREELISKIEHQKAVMAETHKRDCDVMYNIADYAFEFDLIRGTFYERKGDFTKCFGYSPKNYEEAVNLFSQLCSEDYRKKFIRTFRTHNIKSEIGIGHNRISLECPMKLRKDEYSPVYCSAVPIVRDNRPVSVFVYAIVLRNAVLPENIEEISQNRDAVTGLLNFDGFKKEAQDFLEHSGRNGYHILAVIDIDNFHALNRKTNYSYGNDILKDISGILKMESSDGTLIGRVEDDNFILFINDCQKDDDGIGIIDNIFKSLHKTYTFNGRTYPELSACIGVSGYPYDGRSIDELFSNASRAVDIAKINGKNMYLFYNERMKKSWEIETYNVVPNISDAERTELAEFEKCFVPVTDSGSGLIRYYDFLEINRQYGLDFDDINDSVYYGSNITALSLNSIKRLIADIYSLSQEGIALPKLALPTLFDGRDCDTILKAFDEILEQYPVMTSNICIMLSQNMLESMSIKQLAAFNSSLRAFGFKVGVYNAGANNFNIKCFTENMFDRIVFAKSFLKNIDDGIYPVELLVYFIGYFTELGAETALPEGTDESLISVLKEKTHLSFGIHKSEFIMLEDFKKQMQISSVVNEYPVLSHERTSLVLSEKMYDEILEQTNSFIAEWTPRSDVIKLSGSFSKIYGYVLERDNFMRNIRYRKFLHPDDIRKFTEKLTISRSESETPDCFVRVYRKSDDSYVWNKVSFVSARNLSGVPIKIISVFSSVSDERSNHIDERRKDRTDFITSLYNKQATENKIKSYLYDDGIMGNHALIIVEVCGLDNVVSSLGQIFANAVLKEAAQNIRELFRDSDIIGRSSGKHFTIFVKNIRNREKLIEKAEQVCSAVKNQYQSENGNINIFGKAGISLFPDNGQTYDELYSGALNALYFAKHNVSSNISFCSDSEKKVKLLHE